MHIIEIVLHLTLCFFFNMKIELFQSLLFREGFEAIILQKYKFGFLHVSYHSERLEGIFSFGKVNNFD